MIVDYHMHLRNERGEIAHDVAAVEPFVPDPLGTKHVRKRIAD